MISRAFRRIAVILAGALSLAHCAEVPIGGNGDFVPMGEQQEIRTGALLGQEVQKAYAPLDAPALQAYVNDVGQQLAQQSQRPTLPWQITVVDSPDVNTFSLPGGRVYLTRGILAYLNSEAELAGVIAHEIGHVTARHGERVHAAPTASRLQSALMPESGSEPSGSLLPALEQAWSHGYGRDQELEADRLGAEYLAKAGYDPRALINAIGALKNQQSFAVEQARRGGRQLQTYHGVLDMLPGDDAGLKQAVAEAEKHASGHPREGRNEYLQKLAGLVFGDSPEQGALVNNALLHAKLGLAIQFPQDWRVQNRPDRVIAVSPEGDALLELQQGPTNDRPLETLQEGVKLDAGARYDSGRLSGYPAAFAAGAQGGAPVVIADVVFDGTQYLIAGKTRDTAAYERERSALRSAINSFHAITPAERQMARTRVLRLVTARTGTTMAALARQSPLGGGAEAQLRVINDLYPAGEPAPGELLKIVQ